MKSKKCYRKKEVVKDLIPSLTPHNSYSNSHFSSSKDRWINVTSNLSNISRINHSNVIHLIPQTANKFEVLTIPQTANKFEILTNLNKESESSGISVAKDITSCSRNFKKNYQKKTLSTNSSTRKSQKVIMTGDSHVRNGAAELQHNQGANYEVSSFIIPVPKWIQL